MTDAPPQIDIRTINPDDMMERWHVGALLTHLNQSADARIQTTKANVNLWHDVLAFSTFGEALRSAEGYYRKYDAKQPDRQPLGIATLGHLTKERLEYEERKAAHQLPPPKVDKARMSRKMLLRWQAMGHLTDRDPAEYEDR